MDDKQGIEQCEQKVHIQLNNHFLQTSRVMSETFEHNVLSLKTDFKNI